MLATINSVKASKSGKSEVVSFHVLETKETPFGTQRIHKYYNMAFEPGTCKLGEGEEIELDLNQFNVRTTQFNGNEGLWLEFKG